MRLSVFLFALLSLLVTGFDLWGMTVDLGTQSSASSQSPLLLSTVRAFRPVKLYPFTDLRSVTDKTLGEIRLDGKSQRVTATQPVAVFAGNTFRKLFEEYGGRISPDGPLAFKGEISHFSFDDLDGYQAKVGFHFYLADESGKVIWDGHSTGIVKGNGKSITPEAISLIFNDTLRAAYTEMLEDEKLSGVWSGKISNTYFIREKNVTTSEDQRK